MIEPAPRRFPICRIQSSAAVNLFIPLTRPLQLVLLMRYNRLALLGWAVLLCFVGLAGELGSRRLGSRNLIANTTIGG